MLSDGVVGREVVKVQGMGGRRKAAEGIWDGGVGNGYQCTMCMFVFGINMY